MVPTTAVAVPLQLILLCNAAGNPPSSSSLRLSSAWLLYQSPDACTSTADRLACKVHCCCCCCPFAGVCRKDCELHLVCSSCIGVPVCCVMLQR